MSMELVMRIGYVRVTKTPEDTKIGEGRLFIKGAKKSGYCYFLRWRVRYLADKPPYGTPQPNKRFENGLGREMYESCC